MAGRRLVLIATTIAALIPSSVALVATTTSRSCTPTGQIYPNIAETGHASPEVVKFFRDYFTTKSLLDGTAWANTFNRNHTEYYDSTLGITIATTYSALAPGLDILQPANGCSPGRQYPLRILGDLEHGALVYFVATPGFLGELEIRSISSFDFLNGKIQRQVDNWDGRDVNLTAIHVPDPVYPYPFGITIDEKPASVMTNVVEELNQALSSGNATAAAALFNYNGVLEDLTLRLRVEGSISIAQYFERTVSLLPYGSGTEVAHILGSNSGGGYEWKPRNSSNVLYGVTALELDSSGAIKRFTATWNGARLTTAEIQDLAILAPRPGLP